MTLSSIIQAGPLSKPRLCEPSVQAQKAGPPKPERARLSWRRSEPKAIPDRCIVCPTEATEPKNLDSGPALASFIVSAKERAEGIVRH